MERPLRYKCFSFFIYERRTFFYCFCKHPCLMILISLFTDFLTTKFSRKIFEIKLFLFTILLNSYENSFCLMRKQKYIFSFEVSAVINILIFITFQVLYCQIRLHKKLILSSNPEESKIYKF